MSAPLELDEIKRFAVAWYEALDFHAPAEELLSFAADEGLQMIFPEKTLHGLHDLKAWAAGGTYTDGEQAPGVYNIFFDENHNVVSVEAKIDGDTAEVEVVVAWQASLFVPPAAKSKRVALDATQAWVVRRSTKNAFGLELVSYNAMAKPFAYAPGFARL